MSFPTWSDLNDDSLIPPLGARYAPDIGQFAFMVSTEPDVRYLEANSADKRCVPFFLGRLFTLKNDATVAGPYLGSPSAAMILESLITKGASRVVVVGWCGSLSDDLRAGDILIPDSAISDEGTSRNYMEMPQSDDCEKFCGNGLKKVSDFPTVWPSSTLSQTLKASLEEHGIECKTGKVWTTDAIYRETRRKVDFFAKMGAVAVEMECSALFAVARYRKIDLASILIVSDTLSKEEWEPGFKAKRFKESRRKVLDMILNDFHRNPFYDEKLRQ
ncbi:putative purine nucleoside phosphorylase [Desulfamplus magnetovallimortis]|uniref:Putative purine nucleoside phosphorylase n=1 Tax=Desulfamplus magnetovallimortis TaxID=1246637 RepID=L0R521_9BACT|nr:nucleoside phosphorylase [Desulfamplus magnetovallimortis]CCO06620.1 putative purine nucleoside phosphorylase [Desulfamplus magnetovallimortis BW-1]SLM32671.1 putative purine nucleoside phosphorylase [Desulfamplus magnetovallimortis]